MANGEIILINGRFDLVRGKIVIDNGERPEEATPTIKTLQDWVDKQTWGQCKIEVKCKKYRQWWEEVEVTTEHETYTDTVRHLDKIADLSDGVTPISGNVLEPTKMAGYSTPISYMVLDGGSYIPRQNYAGDGVDYTSSNGVMTFNTFTDANVDTFSQSTANNRTRIGMLKPVGVTNLREYNGRLYAEIVVDYWCNTRATRSGDEDGVFEVHVAHVVWPMRFPLTFENSILGPNYWNANGLGLSTSVGYYNNLLEARWDSANNRAVGNRYTPWELSTAKGSDTLCWDNLDAPDGNLAWIIPTIIRTDIYGNIVAAPSTNGTARLFGSWKFPSLKDVP